MQQTDSSNSTYFKAGLLLTAISSGTVARAEVRLFSTADKEALVPIAASPSISECGFFQYDVERHKFSDLADKWESETRHISRSSIAMAHPAFLRMIAMGQVALPLALKRLSENGSPYWLDLLRVLSPIDPSDSVQSADLADLKRAWLDWGAKQGLVSRRP